MPGGSTTVEQLGPAFCAAASTKMPAASVLLTTASSSARVVQPSLTGQLQLLLMAWGRFVGSGFCPALLVGAIMNWKHSVYVVGVPLPWSMFRHPIHFAPGATPTWFPAPSSPAAVPIVCVPCPLSSHGAAAFAPHTPPPEWIASC